VDLRNIRGTKDVPEQRAPMVGGSFSEHAGSPITPGGFMKKYAAVFGVVALLLLGGGCIVFFFKGAFIPSRTFEVCIQKDGECQPISNNPISEER
jgi:hypothetical protein